MSEFSDATAEMFGDATAVIGDEEVILAGVPRRGSFDRVQTDWQVDLGGVTHQVTATLLLPLAQFAPGDHAPVSGARGVFARGREFRIAHVETDELAHNLLLADPNRR